MKKIAVLVLAFWQLTALAGDKLSLVDCRQMAINNNKDLVQQRAKLEMAGYDRTIARANYFPKISAIATYHHTGGGFSLIDDTNIPQFGGLGDGIQASRDALVQQIQGILSADPQLAQQLMQNQAFTDFMRQACQFLI